MESPILNLFLLVLRILLDFSPDASHKDNRFSDALLKKGLKFVSSRSDGTIAFNFGLVPWPAEVDSIPEKRGHKGYMLAACGTGHVEIIFAVTTKVITFHVGATIV